MKHKKRLKNENAITLIALVITIVVLLILVGVAIATWTGDNGILTRASSSKIETAVGAVKEALKLEQGEKRIEGEQLTPETLLAEGKVQRTVQQGEDENYYMYYALKENAIEEMQGLGKGNIVKLKDVFLIDDNLNVKYIASNGKEYGDNINNKILEDETKIRFASKAFSEYVSKISGVTEEEMKFKWMKNQTSLTIADSLVDSLQDLVFFPNLESLTLGEWGNNIPPITTMDGIENCTKLKTLQIIGGPDKDYSAIAMLQNLIDFQRYTGNDYINIMDVLKLSQSLEKLTLQNLNITDMNRIGELKDLTYLNMTHNQISKIEGLDNKSSLYSLNLTSNRIEKIEGLDNLTNLVNLSLTNNRIKDITPISKVSTLKYLDLKQNPDIDPNRNNYTGEKLEALNKIGEILDRDGTINIDVDKLGLFVNYKNLDLSGQNLTTLQSLEGLIQLTVLNLNANRLTLEDEKSQEILKSMTNLQNLNLANNQITDITAINTLNSLNILYLHGKNNIVNLVEIEDIISNLNLLTVNTESLKTITNCDVDKITSLNITAGCSLTEIPDLSKFTKLTNLKLIQNPDISNFQNISKILSLQKLSLSANNMHGRMIDFSKLTNLTNLELKNNNLWSEDLENLKDLKNNSNLTIDLSSNSIIDASALLELNPNTKIDLRNNINLSQDSNDKLKARFGNNVTF